MVFIFFAFFSYSALTIRDQALADLLLHGQTLTVQWPVLMNLLCPYFLNGYLICLC